MTVACVINPYRHAGNVNFTVSGVDFPGAATGWLERDADLTDNSDGQAFTLSVWLDGDALNVGEQIYSTGNNQILVRITSGGSVEVIGENTGGTQVINYRSPAASVTTGWKHIITSFDLGTAGRRWIRIDGVDQTITQVVFTTGETVDWTQADHAIGANPGAGGSSYNGGMAELWITHAWVDNTDANVLKFISQTNVNGTPVDLGATGTNPGLGTPIIWLTRRASGTVADFISNNGSGGGFTSKGATGLTDRGVVT